jgi:hypothetical protein
MAVTARRSDPDHDGLRVLGNLQGRLPYAERERHEQV